MICPPRWVPALLAVLLAPGCRESNAPAPEPTVAGQSISFPRGSAQLSAIAVEPATRDTAASARLFGHLTWDDDATVRVFTPFAGRVRRVRVDVGETVRPGTPLAEVESPDFGEAQAEARTADSDLRLATSNLARERELFDHGVAARKEVEAAEADEARARAQSGRARARLASCGAQTDAVDGLFLLRSPIAGTVVERTLTPGQEIRPDQMLANAPQLFSPLFVLSDPTRLWIQIDAAEADLPLLRSGTRIRFLSTAYPGRTFEGRIDHVSESIDPGTHTLRARGTVENRDRLLKAEMFVGVIVPGRPAAAASVPSSAVFLRGDRHYVFVERAPGHFERREVRIGAERDTDITVSAGLRPGDRVVTDGCVLLQRMLD